MELSIALEKPCYFPGELLKCHVKVSRLAGAPAAQPAHATVDQLQLSFECSGTERVDPSWVHHLYLPEVTAAKDNRRLVRSIFSTGQVPLLNQADRQPLIAFREFIVSCRLPHKLPPSYRGNAMRFVYQVVVRGLLLPNAAAASLQQLTTPSQQLPRQQQRPQQQQKTVSCQAACSFVVWPANPSSTIQRRASLPIGPTSPTVAAVVDGSSLDGSSSSGAIAGDVAGATVAGETDGPPQIDYRLGMQVSKLCWEEVVTHSDGTRTLLQHQSSGQLNPPIATSSSAAASQLLAAQSAPSDALIVDEGQQRQQRQRQQLKQQQFGTGQDSDMDVDQSAEVLRHPAPLPRAGMAVKTFDLRAGDHPLLRLVLQPPPDGLLHPGGSLGLLLDMRAAHGQPPGSSQQPNCMQVTALLESEEVVPAGYTHSRNSSDTVTMRKLHSEQQEVTAHLLTSHFIFSIPLTAPPSFLTPMVCHRWTLRFELEVVKPKPNRPGEYTTEQLLWSLPLVVWPPPPTPALSTY